MGWNDHIGPTEDDLADVLRYLIEEGWLEDAQLGVAWQVIASGRDSLSPRQAQILRGIERAHFVEACQRCGMEVPLGEMIGAMFSGLCAYCEHMTDKDD
jgi:hypothetical protein